MKKQLMKGNEAIAQAAIQAGCKCFFGYPITPQNEIPEYMSSQLPQNGGVFVQAESEVSAINMVYGAAGAGARVMTSSSGLGIALKQEGISNICGAEVPCVIVNIARGGPGLGSIQPSQCDYYQMTRGGGNGDYSMIVYAPDSVQEAADLTQLAFDKADEYRNPVAVLGDGAIGQMMEPVEINDRLPDPNLPEKTWALGYGDASKRPHNVINSLYLDSNKLEQHNLRLQAKYRQMKEKEVMVEYVNTEDADIIVIAYGTSSRIVRSAMKMAEQQGLKVGMVRPITLWPFPEKEIYDTVQTAKAVLCVEMSAGQMLDDVKIAVNGTKKIYFYSRLGGIIPKPRDVLAKLIEIKEEF